MATPVTERRPDPAPAAPVRPVRLGPRDVVVERRPDGTIHLRSPHPLPPYPAKLTERLEHWAAAAPERIFMAQRDAAGGWRTISYARGARSGPAHRRSAADARSLARAADRDPVRQRHRARAARPRRHVCRHPLRADLAGLFADLAATSASCATSSTCSRPAWSSPPTATPSRRAIEAVVPPDVRGRRHPQSDRRDGTATPFDELAATDADRGRRRRARQGRARHHRQVPVHLRLDRHAQGRDQHPAHVVLEPGDDPLAARLSSPTSRR